MSAVSNIGTPPLPPAKMAAPLPASSTPPASGAFRSVDQVVTVALSDEAVQRMANATQIDMMSHRTVQAAATAAASLSPDALARVSRLTGEGYKAFSAWREDNARYQSQLNDVVRSKLNIPDGYGMMVSDNVRDAFKAMGAENGLVEPEMPPEAAMFAPSSEPASPSLAPNIGFISIFDASPNASVPPGSVTMVFDSAVAGAAVGSNLVKLGSSDTSATTNMSGSMKDAIGALNAWSSGMSSSSAYALTIGEEGDEAKTAAFITTLGGDDIVQNSASDMLSTLLHYIKH